jgi:uncharacterized protein YneF (UPF0154 family)
VITPEWLLLLIVFLLVLVVGGYFADKQDPDRVDANRQNHVRRGR